MPGPRSDDGARVVGASDTAMRHLAGDARGSVMRALATASVRFHVVAGAAGCGKTCFLRTLAYCHAESLSHGGIDAGLFHSHKRVLFLRLRDLAGVLARMRPAVAAAAAAPAVVGAAAAAFVAAQYGLGGVFDRTALAAELFSSLSATTLWLLDGFDELAGAGAMVARIAALAAPLDPLTPLPPSSAVEAAVEAVVLLLASQPHVIVTTRPQFARDLDVTAHVQIEPCDPALVRSFVLESMAGHAAQRDALLARMAAQPALAEAMRVPVIMHMAISAETGDEVESRPLGASVGAGAVAAAVDSQRWVVAQLYERVLRRLRLHLAGKCGLVGDADADAEAAQWARLLAALRQLALEGCAANKAVLAWHEGADLLAALAKGRIVELVEAGTVEFVHRSLQEYVAAQAVLTAIPRLAASSGASEARAALVGDGNDMLRRFVMAGATSAADAAAVAAALWPHETAGFGEAAMVQLAQCVRECRFATALPCRGAVEAHAADSGPPTLAATSWRALRTRRSGWWPTP